MTEIADQLDDVLIEPPADPIDATVAARAALARGDLIATYDLAQTALARDGGLAAAYLLVLALARMGDTAAARAHYAARGLDVARDVDSRALGARLAKDAAEALTGAERARAYAAASAAYAAIHDDTGDAFPGINAASLALLSGEAGAARERAAGLLEALPEPTDFWGAATRTEALLLLGRDAEAETAIRAALTLPGCNPGARSTTARQFELLAHAGLDALGRVRAALKPPVTLFYCGHMFLPDADVEAELAAHIDAVLDATPVAVAYGALACGTDILVAERLLARGVELNVVLPYPADQFAALSVDPGGRGWRARFDTTLAAATSVHVASPIGDIGDPAAFSYSSNIAMGLTRLRARQIGGPAQLLAVWDGQAARGIAGTAVDVAAWQSAGGETIILGADRLDRRLDRPRLPAAYDGPARAVMAVVFADVPGFARLTEVELPPFWRDVMGTVARVLDAHAGSVKSRNSWGDALFAVVDGSAVAAELVLSLQEALARLGTGATLRVGVHYGAMFATPDPITGLPTFYGSEVARAARIEPVTPPGQVYVTESFAAALAMSAPDRFTCRYVGRVALAKDYGTFPMYRLSRVN